MNDREIIWREDGCPTGICRHCHEWGPVVQGLHGLVCALDPESCKQRTCRMEGHIGALWLGNYCHRCGEVDVLFPEDAK